MAEGRAVPTSRPRVLVVDDASQTRDTFALAYPALEMVGAYAGVEALLADGRAADLVVLDLQLSTGPGAPPLQGPAAIKELCGRRYRVCVYTDERRLLVLAHCFAAGAAGLVRKSDPLADNQTSFLNVAAGRTVVPSSLVGLAELLGRRGRLPELTPRQAEVLAARARGETWDALARRLGITPKTAYDRLEAAMAKMVWYLHDAGLGPGASPGDIERALGLSPGDLSEPGRSKDADRPA